MRYVTAAAAPSPPAATGLILIWRRALEVRQYLCDDRWKILEYRGDIATMLTTTKFRSHPLPIGGYAAFYCDIQVHV